MSWLGVPRRTAALIGANSLSAAVQGQFQFVLPWMLLTRGHSPQAAAFAAGLVYVPLLLTAVPAGVGSDNTDPRRLMRAAIVISLMACALYPLAALAGYDTFVLVLLAAVVVGSVRNFAEGALFRSIGDTTRGASLLRAHALRSTVNQAAVFGSPFLGLLLFRVGGVDAMMIGVCVLLVVAITVLGFVPGFERESSSVTAMRETVSGGIASLRANSQLRAMGWANLTWNIFAGAAMGIMPSVLREHLGMDEAHASVTFIAGAIVVVVLTLPVVRAAQNRVGAITTFIVAITVQGLAVVLFADPRAAILGPLIYCLFLLSNSTAAASLNGARAAEVENDYQGLLNMALLTVGMIGFIAGVMLAAVLIEQVGFIVVLALIGAGMAATAVCFRRPLMEA
ncbi:MAG: MFS transporter [Thermoleophilia bacterium]